MEVKKDVELNSTSEYFEQNEIKNEKNIETPTTDCSSIAVDKNTFDVQTAPTLRLGAGSDKKTVSMSTNYNISPSDYSYVKTPEKTLEKQKYQLFSSSYFIADVLGNCKNSCFNLFNPNSQFSFFDALMFSIQNMVLYFANSKYPKLKFTLGILLLLFVSSLVFSTLFLTIVIIGVVILGGLLTTNDDEIEKIFENYTRSIQKSVMKFKPVLNVNETILIEFLSQYIEKHDTNEDKEKVRKVLSKVYLLDKIDMQDYVYFQNSFKETVGNYDIEFLTNNEVSLTERMDKLIELV